MQDRRLNIFFILLLMLLFSTNKNNDVLAQDFTQLNWEEMRIDSTLPYYTEVIPLETNHLLNTYSVQVLYPEWQELSKRETHVAKQFSKEIAETLKIQTEIGVSRGEGFIDLKFIPLIHQRRKYKKLISGKIVITAHPKAPQIRKAHKTQRWKSHSALANGKWVKIGVTTDGIYHLTHTQLTSMGFSNPQNIVIMGYGGHRQEEVIDADNDWDDLDTVSVLPVADGYLFHANGLIDWREGQHYINHYANSACYFITEGTPKTMPSEENAMPNDPVYIQSVTDYYVHDPQEYSWYQGGRVFFENYDYASGNSRTYTLTLPTYPENAKATLTIAFSAADTASTKVSPAFNGTSLSTFSITKLTDSYSSAVLKDQTYSIKNLQESNSLRIITTSNHHARLNYLKLQYDAKLQINAAKPFIQFNHKATNCQSVLMIEYAQGQNPQVWQVGKRRNPTTMLKGTLKDIADNQGVVHHYTCIPIPQSNIEQTFVAFDANAYTQYPQPTFISNITNQDLHSLGALDMIIITPANGIYNKEAERLADVHRQYDGLGVGVFQADVIYNEFSSGTPDATAYRRFMKMLYDRGLSTHSAPRYLLLFGDGAWDNRMLTPEWKGKDPNNFLLTYESENSVSDILCYVMEDYFGLLDDGEGAKLTSEKIDLGIGRFPIQNTTQAKTLVNKTISFIQKNNIGAWKNIVCFLGDDGDNNEHLRYADAVAKNVEKTHPEIEVRKIMWDAYKREGDAAGYRYPQVTEAIIQQMNEGTVMMNYTGHGATYTLSHEHVLTLDNFKNFNTPHPPLWVTAACDIMPFDGLKENIGETAVLHESGSAIAFYGTTRTVYAYNNLIINQAFCSTVFEKDELGRANTIGDAVRLSKVKIITEGSELGNLQNKLHYVLLGDPAITIANHQNHLVVDSINHIAIKDLGENFTLHAGGKAHFQGHVEGTSHEIIPSYYGTVTARLFDSESTITCLNNAGSSSAFVFNTYDKVLYSGQDSIRNGQFSLTFPIPLDIKYSNETGRLVLFGRNNANTIETNGYSHHFLIGGTEPGLTDTIGPQIYSYLDTEDFQDGDAVGVTPYFVAKLQDESGINTSGNGIGHNLELIIDNNALTTYNLDAYYTNAFGNYQQGTVNFSIPALDEGNHTLTFRAWDIMNNSATESYSFYVDPSKAINVNTLTVSQSPATVSTNFIIYYDRPGSLCNYTIEVFDFSGRLVWSLSGEGSNDSGVFTIPWDLSGAYGQKLNSGIYLYRARISTNDVETTTKAQKLIINRRQ